MAQKLSTAMYVAIFSKVPLKLTERKMYDNAMGAIHEHLIQKTVNTKMTYTAELIPEQNPNGQM